MPRIDVATAFTPAFNHMVRVLFRPFSLKMWLSLGFVAMVAYGGSSFHANLPSSENQPPPPGLQEPFQWMMNHMPLIIAAMVALMLIGLVLLWVSSILKLVYIDQITNISGAIREPFARLKRFGTSFFLWQLAFGTIATVILVLVIGLPIFLAARDHPLGGIQHVFPALVWAVLAGLPLLIVTFIISIMANDFVIPAMYTRGVKVMEAWRIVFPILRANIGQMMIYLLILIAVAIGMAMYGVLALLVVGLALAIPVGLLALIGYLIWQAAHLTWTPATIGVVVSLAVVVVFAFLYAGQCALQPAMVFRRSLSLVVLGQADDTLVTVPTGNVPPVLPQE